MNPEAAGAIAVAAGVGVYAMARASIKFWQQDLRDRLHYRRNSTSLADEIEPYTHQSRVLLGADPHGDIDAVGSEAERWLRDQPPPAADPPAG